LNNFFKVDKAPSPHKYKRRGRRFYIIVLIERFLQQPLEKGGGREADGGFLKNVSTFAKVLLDI